MPHPLRLGAALAVMALLAGGCGRARPTAQPVSAPPSAAASDPGTTPSPQPSSSATVAAPEPTAVQADLPGAVLVMVDNFSAARPQSGLDAADVVYEAWAEFGITRFLALFYRHAAPKIGPIRSARFYFVELADAYHAPSPMPAPTPMR